MCVEAWRFDERTKALPRLSVFVHWTGTERLLRKQAERRAQEIKNIAVKEYMGCAPVRLVNGRSKKSWAVMCSSRSLRTGVYLRNE